MGHFPYVELPKDKKTTKQNNQNTSRQEQIPELRGQ